MRFTFVAREGLMLTVSVISFIDSVRMVILSIQICNGLKVLKILGLHPANEIATNVEVFTQFAQQQMDGCSSFFFPIDMRQHPFDCNILLTISDIVFKCKSWQSVLFGKYLIRPNAQYARMLA